jgi:hypothetical protein
MGCNQSNEHEAKDNHFQINCKRGGLYDLINIPNSTKNSKRNTSRVRTNKTKNIVDKVLRKINPSLTPKNYKISLLYVKAKSIYLKFEVTDNTKLELKKNGKNVKMMNFVLKYEQEGKRWTGLKLGKKDQEKIVNNLSGNMIALKNSDELIFLGFRGNLKILYDRNLRIIFAFKSMVRNCGKNGVEEFFYKGIFQKSEALKFWTVKQGVVLFEGDGKMRDRRLFKKVLFVKRTRKILLKFYDKKRKLEICLDLKEFLEEHFQVNFKLWGQTEFSKIYPNDPGNPTQFFFWSQDLANRAEAVKFAYNSPENLSEIFDKKYSSLLKGMTPSFNSSTSELQNLRFH